MATDPLEARQKANGPKRMLALDGGGVRGLITLGYLDHIESHLRERYHNPRLVLSDYFDFIGGTSTGSIIASLLSIGNETETIIRLYKELSKIIFKKTWWRKGVFLPKYRAHGLEEALDRCLGDITFNSPAIKTGLMIVIKRWDTGSPWILHNIRGNRYYDKYTSKYAIKDVVRASTAAPSYFGPKKLNVKGFKEGAFVDGGVSPHNNPALQMLMLALIDGYGLNWQRGEDQLSITSIGTGNKQTNNNPDSWKVKISAMNGVTSLRLLMDDTDALNRTLLQWMSQSPRAEKIDSEIKDLSGELLTSLPLLHYIRYNVGLNRTDLQELGLGDINDNQLEAIQEMENTDYIDLLLDIGRRGASSQVSEDHFPAPFDLPLNDSH